MIHLGKYVSSRLMNGLEIRDEMSMARRQRLFLQDLAESQNIAQTIAQIVARSVELGAQKLAGRGARRLRAGNQRGLHGRPSLPEWRQDFGRRLLSHRLGLRKRLAHFLCGLVTLVRIVSACFKQDIIELSEPRFDFTRV